MNGLNRFSSPHMHGPQSSQMLMGQVLLATLPGIAALVWFFGWGVIVNICLASIVATGCETFAVMLRKKQPLFYLRDLSALVTAFLLGIALPPYAPWWLIVAAVATAILFGKHIYGGLGNNPFNPAMVGYVIALISFPVQMTNWAAPLGVAAGFQPPGLLEALRLCLTGSTGTGVDMVTAATPLDIIRNSQLTASELQEQNLLFGKFGARGWEWANIGFLAGGLWLLWRRIFSWHAPVGMLGALVILSAIFYRSDSSGFGSPLFHLVSGATMLGAFFIVTDPVSGATSKMGRLVFGIGTGSLLYWLRVASNSPDAVAFAILLMNFTAPLIDNFTRPRTYGYNSR